MIQHPCASISRLAFALALTLATFAAPARAAAPWTPFGPGGGVIQSLAVDPGNPAVVYAVAGYTLYKSTDAGATWTVLAGPNLQFVALDPGHPGTVYTAGQVLLRSTDSGRTWTDVTPELSDSALISALAVAPDGVVFASVREHLLRSADGGRSWPVVAEDNSDILSILVDPGDPRHVFHQTYKDLYASDDGGLLWTPLTVPASMLDLTGVALAPSSPNRLYFLSQADGVVLRSDDRGASWSAAGRPPRVSGILSFQVDPRSPDRLYAASWEGIFTSGDGGATWREITAGLPRPLGQRPQIFSFTVAPSQPSTLYAGTDDGIGRSLDSGAHWRVGLEIGLDAGTPHLLKFHPLRPETVYLALGGAGDRSFRSTDGGRTWTGFARSISEQGLDDLAFDPVDPDLLYAANRTAIWRSRDGGESWTRISGQTPLRVADLGHHTLLASRCGVLRSTDDGRSWKQVIPCGNANDSFRTPISLSVDPRDPRTVYVHFSILEETHNYFFEVFRSRDGGVTWTKIKALSAPTAFAVAPSDFRVLYAVDQSLQAPRLFRSANGGATWRVVNRALPPELSFIFSEMVVDSADPNTIYLAANPLQVSHDGGATFKPFTAPFEAGKRTAGELWTDLARPGILYVGAYDGGLFAGKVE